MNASTCTFHTEKIPFKLISEGVGRQNIEKCRIILGVIGLRPPPGGAQAAHIVTSLICFQKSLSLSYSPLKS